MINKNTLIELLSEEDETLEIECHIDVSTIGGKINGDERKVQKKYTIKFTIIE